MTSNRDAICNNIMRMRWKRPAVADSYFCYNAYYRIFAAITIWEFLDFGVRRAFYATPLRLYRSNNEKVDEKTGMSDEIYNSRRI